MNTLLLSIFCKESFFSLSGGFGTVLIQVLLQVATLALKNLGRKLRKLGLPSRYRYKSLEAQICFKSLLQACSLVVFTCIHFFNGILDHFG
jgi:hypothetical protein